KHASRVVFGGEKLVSARIRRYRGDQPRALGRSRPYSGFPASGSGRDRAPTSRGPAARSEASPSPATGSSAILPVGPALGLAKAYALRRPGGNGLDLRAQSPISRRALGRAGAYL